MELFDWNAAAANNNATPPDGWPEFMEYSEVNNSAREGMAVLARFYRAALSGLNLTAGTASAYTLVSGQTFAAYAAGQVFAFTAHATSTGTVTLNVDGKGTVGIVDARNLPLGEGDIVAGGAYLVVKTSTTFRVIGALSASSLQLQVGNTLRRAITTTGTATAYLVAAGSLLTPYQDGQMVAIVPHVTSGTAPTISIDGQAAELLKDASGATPVTGLFAAGVPVIFVRQAGEWRSMDRFIDMTVLGAFSISDATQRKTFAESLAQVGSGFGTATTIASAATTDLGTILSHNVTVTGTTTITSFGSSANTASPIYKVKFASALTLTHNATSLIIPGARDLTIAANDTVEVEYLGSGNWRVLAHHPAVPVYGLAGVNGLTITNNTGTPTTRMDITTTGRAILENTDGATINVGPQTLTINASTTGANALDTGALANNTWYHMYLISNGITTAALMSTSATAPVMPSGYTYKLRIGAVRTLGAATFIRVIQRGRRAGYVVVAASVTPNLPIIGSGAVGSVITPTWVGVTVSNASIPATATEIIITTAHTSSSGSNVTLVAPNSAYGNHTSLTNPAPYQNSMQNDGGKHNIPAHIVLESTQIFWAADNGTLAVVGWIDAVNAS